MSAPDLLEVGATVVIGEARRELALSAAWEIEELCNVLCAAVPPRSGSNGLVVRGLAARVRALACAVMGALGDEGESTAEIAKRVRIDLTCKEGDA